MTETKIREAIKSKGYKIGQFADLMGYHNNTLTPRLQQWNTKDVLKKISLLILILFKMGVQVSQ